MIFFPLAFAFSLVAALPAAPLAERDIWAPHILIPDATTSWVAGQKYNVTWDVTSMPHQVSNPVGEVHLRHGDATQNTALVQGFKLSAGTVEVAIPPDTKPDTNWQVVLIGISNNWSPLFTITKPLLL